MEEEVKMVHKFIVSGDEYTAPETIVYRGKKYELFISSVSIYKNIINEFTKYYKEKGYKTVVKTIRSKTTKRPAYVIYRRWISG